MIDDQNFIRQEQHHVALVVGTLQLQLDRIELEGEVVAEGTVKAKVGIFLRKEQVGNGAKDSEHRRHLRAFFFGEHPVRHVDGQIETAGRRRAKRDIGNTGQMRCDHLQQRFAALVIGLDPQ